MLLRANTRHDAKRPDDFLGGERLGEVLLVDRDEVDRLSLTAVELACDAYLVAKLDDCRLAVNGPGRRAQYHQIAVTDVRGHRVPVDTRSEGVAVAGLQVTGCDELGHITLVRRRERDDLDVSLTAALLALDPSW